MVLDIHTAYGNKAVCDREITAIEYDNGFAYVKDNKQKVKADVLLYLKNRQIYYIKSKTGDTELTLKGLYHYLLENWYSNKVIEVMGDLS